MILHTPRTRPKSWKTTRQHAGSRWLVPLFAFEYVSDWVAYFLSNWSFLEVLEYLGTFSVLIGVIFYFSESGDRVKQRHYQAWQVINTAQGKGGSGGRIEALEELNADKVPLVGVDVSSAFLQGLNLKNANLMRADFSSADLRNSNLIGVNFTLANLHSANLRDSSLDHAVFVNADLADADLAGSSLLGSDLSGAVLDNADLSQTDLKDVQWQRVKSVKGATLAGVRNPPEGFQAWAMSHGAVDNSEAAQ